MRRIKYILFTTILVGAMFLGGCGNEKNSTSEITTAQEGWNEEKTIYTNSYGMTITKNEFEYLKTELLTPLDSEDDLEIFIDEKQKESIFPVFLNYEDILYEGVLYNKVALLPEGAKEVGTVKAIREDQDFVYTGIEPFEVTKNAVKLGIAQNSSIYQNENRKELLYVESKEKDGYFIFIQKDTGFQGEWNEEHTIYTNAKFVDIPKEVYDAIGVQIEREGETLEKYINLFYQFDLDLHLPFDLRYDGKLYRMNLFEEPDSKQYQMIEKYEMDEEFLNGIKEIAQIKALVGDNIDRTVKELEITANAGGAMLGIKVGTPIYQNEENQEVFILKNDQLVVMDSLSEEQETDTTYEEETSQDEETNEEYFYFFQVKEN